MSTVQSSASYLEVGVGTAWVKLCSTDNSFDFQMETDDITDKCSNRSRETKSEIKQINISSNGIYDTANTALAKIKSRFLATTDETLTISAVDYECGAGQCAGRFTDAGGSTYAGIVQINSYNESSAFNQEVRFSFDSQFSGAPTVA